MKTAMQELEDKLKDNLKWIVMNADYELMDKLFIEGLEKEKEQIMNAFDMGKTTIKFVEEAEEYYNQTYNQEPKKEYQPSEKYLKKQRELIENFIWNKNNQNK